VTYAITEIKKKQIKSISQKSEDLQTVPFQTSTTKLFRRGPLGEIDYFSRPGNTFWGGNASLVRLSEF